MFKLSKHMISDLCAICLEYDEQDRTSLRKYFIYFIFFAVES